MTLQTTCKSPEYPLVSHSTDDPPSTRPVQVAPGVMVGGPSITVIAGPCAVEGPEMILDCAKAVKTAGATMLRGGAYKPRTSPYAFQGMGEQGVELLSEARRQTGFSADRLSRYPR
jgi:3-deoxy-7-phosphoheptulonate synthase